MAQSFHLFHGEPTVTSSPTEVRVWVEELDYSFLAYGENFERAEINGEKLLSITRQKLKELGVTRTGHQDIILKAVANINKKTKLEEQAMQGEDKSNKMLPTRFRRQSELLEHALDQLFDRISERRRARIIYGSNEDPPHNILTAALELINVVKMILNILERSPLDCMSEFSSLKNHLIKHITLLKYLSEQSDLNNEMESDMIDVCKNVTKMCHYIIALPPEITGPEELTPKLQVPVAIECKAVTFSFEHGPDYVHPTRCLSMPITAKSSSSEHVLPLQDMSLQNKIVPCRSEYVSPETLNTPSHKDAVMMPRDEDKSETEVSDTKGSDTSAGSLDYKILQDLLIIENVSPLPDSGSEICEIDSDSDRGIGLDYDLEQQWKDSDSVMWGMDSDSEMCPKRSDSVKHLLEAERYPRDSDSVKDLMESEQHLVEVEQFQVDYDSLKYWGDSDSEKCLEYSDSEKCLMDSDNERPEIDSDSEKCPMASVSVKHLLKAEKFQMASDSIQRLLDSEKRLMDIKQHCIVSESEEYVMDSSMEKDKIGSASASGVHLIGKEKYQEKTRSKRYRMDSDSEPCRVDSDLERHALATMAAKCLMGTKIYQLSTDTEGRRMDFLSERHTMDLDSESLGRASDSVKHMMKAKRCQSKPELERFWMDLKCESEKSLTDSERQQLDFDYDRCRDSSRRYQHRSARFQGSSERRQVDFKKHWNNFERHQLDSDSKKHPANSENEKSNEFESERHMMERERERCLIQFENKRLQLDEEQENYGMDSDREKEHQITPDNERQRLDSENEAQRLGARKKDNRPPDFWRPIFLSPSVGPAKKTEEKHSMQQTGNKAVSRTHHVRHLSDEKIVRCKEVSPTPSNKEDSQQKFKEMHSQKLSPDPKHQRNASYKISVCKSRYKEYRWLQSFQSSGSQINPFNLLNAEDYTAEVSALDCHPTSMSTWSAIRPKIHRYSSDTRATICSKCSKEITNSHFHKCLMDSDNDSDPDCPPHIQIPLGSKYFLSPKSIRHHNTYWNSPLSQSMDPKHSVNIHCPLHQRDSKYSLGSTSYLHCDSCLTPQNLMGSTDTHTLPLNPQNTTCYHGTPGPDNIINISNVVGLESEGQFNLTSSQLENESNTYETKLVSADNLKNGANAKDKPILKDERNDETDSEGETDSEDEEDPEDENNTKVKKDPKDKSDPDNCDPKDRNTENDTDTNNGSDSSGDADPTSGADSNSDGDSNNETDSSTNPDSTIDKNTNNNANSNYSTDSEKKYTINSDNSSGLDNDVDQDCIAGLNNGTNLNDTSVLQQRTGVDHTFSYNKGASLSNPTRSGNDICSNNGTDTTNEAGPNNNRPDPNLNGSSLQNNGPGCQNNRQVPNIPGFNNNGSDLNINGLHPNNNPALNNNSPVSNNNIPVLKNYLDSNNNARPNHATRHNSAFSSNKDADSNSDTKPTSAAGHNYSAVTNYNSELDYIPRFSHALDSNFAVNTSFSIAKTSYAARPISTTSSVNVTDTNTTSCGGAITPSYIAYTNFSSDANYETRFTHAIGSNFAINTNCYVINTLNVHNSTNARKINNLSEPILEIGSSSSIPNIVYGSTPTFVAEINYTSTPKNLTTSTFSDSYTLGINYTIIDNQKFDVFSKGNDGSVDCAIFMHVTESKDVLDAKKCCLLQDLSSFQNHNGIKDTANLNFHSTSNILLLSFDIIVGAEQPDVKFAISSGAVNQFFKSLDNYCDILRAEGEPLREAMQETTKRSSEGPARESAMGSAQESLRGTVWGLKGGLPMISVGGHAVSSARGHAVSPARRGCPERCAKEYTVSPVRGLSKKPEWGLAVSPARGRSVSPARGRVVSPARGFTVRPEEQLALSSTRKLSVSPARGYAVNPEKRHAERHAREHAMSPMIGLALNPARGYAVNPEKRHAERHAREHAMSPTIGLALNPARGYAVNPEKRHAERHAREHAMSPTIGLALNPARGYAVKPEKRHAERHAREHAMSPTIGLALNPARGYAVNPEKRHAERHAREHAMSPTIGLALNPARGYAVKPEKRHAERHAREHAMSPTIGLAVNPARSYAMNPEKGHAERHAREHAMSPTIGLALNPARGYSERHTRGHALSPTKRSAVSSARGRSITPARGHAETHTRGHTVSPTRGLAVNPARSYVVNPARGYVVNPARGRSMNLTREHAKRHARKHTMSPTMGLSVNPERAYVVSPTKIHVDKHVREHSVSPTGRHTVSHAGRCAERQARQHIWSPLKRYAVSPAHGFAGPARRTTVNPTRRSTVRPANELVLGSVVELTVKPAEGYAAKSSRRSAKQSTRSTTDKNQNRRRFPIVTDTKADGFIHLPEFRIHLAPHCRNNNWVGQMLQLAYGSSFGDAAAHEEYRCICASIYVNCILALMREFSVIWCNICNHPTPIVSVSQKFLHRHSQDVPDEFIYFRPIHAEVQEEAKRQKQQKPTIVSHQHTREEHSRPRTPINLWLDSPENATSLGNDDFEVERSMYPFRERAIIRRSWEELLEAPLNNEGLHILQTIPAEEREIGYLQLPLEEENQATTSLRSHHLHVFQGPFPLLPQRTKLQRQYSHSSPRYSDIRSQKFIAPMLKVNPEEKHFLASDHTLFTQENTNEKESIKETWQNAILSTSGEHSINPSVENSTSMRGKLGIPGDNGRYPRDNIRVPIDNVIIPMANVGVSMDNAAVPLDNFGVPRGNLEVPRGLGGVPRCHAIRIPMFNVETPRNNVGTSRRVVSSPLIELSKIGEHRL